MKFFQIFFIRIGLDWRALVESRSPNIEKEEILYNFVLLKKIFFNFFFDILRFLDLLTFVENF